MSLEKFQDERNPRCINNTCPTFLLFCPKKKVLIHRKMHTCRAASGWKKGTITTTTTLPFNRSVLQSIRYISGNWSFSYTVKCKQKDSTVQNYIYLGGREKRKIEEELERGMDAEIKEQKHRNMHVGIVAISQNFFSYLRGQAIRNVLISEILMTSANVKCAKNLLITSSSILQLKLISSNELCNSLGIDIDIASHPSSL